MKRIRLARYVALMGERRGAYRILVKELEGAKPLRRIILK